MKIFITTHHLEYCAGSEIFTQTLARELVKKGHDVCIFSPHLGAIFQKRFEEMGVKVTDNLLDLQNESFDIIHAQHNVTAILARSVFPETPMIFMSHGRIPELEQPPSIDLGISAFLVIAESGKKRLETKYLINPNKVHIFRNLIDTEKFRSRKLVSEKLKNLLVISHHFPEEAKKIVEDACRETEIEFRHIGFPENPVENVEDFINEADLVVTLGRGAHEAMACERNVIVYDMHGADGFVDEKNFFEIRKNNFSGLRYGYNFSKDDFKRELGKYDPELGKKLRVLILKENSAANQTEKIVKIYQAAVKEKVAGSQIQKGQLQRELIFLENEAKEIYPLRRRILELEAEKSEVIQRTERLDEELKRRDERIESQQNELNLMKSSKFWKLRGKYLKLKKMAGMNAKQK